LAIRVMRKDADAESALEGSDCFAFLTINHVEARRAVQDRRPDVNSARWPTPLDSSDSTPPNGVSASPAIQ
jgi:hypothetical protein